MRFMGAEGEAAVLDGNTPAAPLVVLKVEV